MAAVPTAHAGVIYTANANLTASAPAAGGGSGVFFTLPLGGGAFAFTAYNAYTDPTSYASSSYVEASKNGAFVKDSSGVPALLSFGSVIGAATPSWAYDSSHTCGVSGSGTVCGNFYMTKVAPAKTYPLEGNWPNDLNQPQYIGLSFTDAGTAYSGTTTNYYGWALVGVAVSPNSSQIEVYSYAYNDTPNASIEAGQTADATPEPGSLALMIVGAAGVVALKRRRKSSQA
jgi:hypothetical protein